LARVVGALDHLHRRLVCHRDYDILAKSRVKNYF
jgi:hypothetical protein